MNVTDIQKEIKDIETKLSQSPSDEKLTKSLVDNFIKLGKFDSYAIDYFSLVYRKNPDQPIYQRALSTSLLIKEINTFVNNLIVLEDVNQTMISHSIEGLNDEIVNYPQSPEINKALGDLYLLKGSYLKAIEYYRIASANDYKPLEDILKLISFIAKQINLPPPVLIFQAELYRKAGDIQSSIEVYEEIIQCGYFDPQLMNRIIEMLKGELANPNLTAKDANAISQKIIRLYLDLDEISNALAVFKDLDLNLLEDFSLCKKVAKILIVNGDYRQAFDYLSSIPLDYQTKKLLNEIATQLEQSGEYDTALYVLKFINENDAILKQADIIREKEILVNTDLELADLHFKKGKFDSALEKYLAAINSGYPNKVEIIDKLIKVIDYVDANEEALVVIGDSFFDKADYYAASQYYIRVKEKNSFYPNINKKLRDIYEKILFKNPDLPEVRLSSGDLFFDENDYERAIEEYKYASTFASVIDRANRKLAIAYMRTGNYRLSLNKFKSIKIEADDISDLYNLHRCFVNNGQVKEALQTLDSITELDPNYKDIQDIRKQLEKKVQYVQDSILIDPKMKELIGDQATGRYKYVGKIGSGGMGVVYKVYDSKVKSDVAMKILREGLSHNNKALDRFFREARISAQLNHRNIVKIYDYNINNVQGQSYITMEFIDGPSLREIIEDIFTGTSEKVNIDYIKKITYYMYQLCDALVATHGHGLIHRDIKPDNIMITSHDILKITDFGIVHIESATFTPTGAMIGTPRYMSPEQVEGGAIDRRSDIYSLGIIFYEMLIGSPPFFSGDIAYQQVHVAPQSPSQILEMIDPVINKIIMKSLEKKPRDRYQDAKDLKIELSELLNDWNYLNTNTETQENIQTVDKSDSVPKEEESDFELSELEGLDEVKKEYPKTLKEHKLGDDLELD